MEIDEKNYTSFVYMLTLKYQLCTGRSIHLQLTNVYSLESVDILRQKMSRSRDREPSSLRYQGVFKKNRVWAHKTKRFLDSILYKIISFNVWVGYFVWHFKGYLWNSTQNISLIHWKVWILFTGEYLRALRFKSSYVFLKGSQRQPVPILCFGTSVRY